MQFPEIWPQVWLSPLDSGLSDPEEALSWLDQQERGRHAAFRHPLAAQRFLLARLLLKAIVARLEGIKPQQVQLSYTSNGKPYLPGAGRTNFSISHCAGAVAVAFASFAIGVDLETVERPRQPWRKPASFLHPSAAGWVARQPLARQSLAFTHCWTCQEAAVKLLDTSIFSERARLVLTEDLLRGECDGRQLHFASWQPCVDTGTATPLGVDTVPELHSGLVISLAANAPLPPVEFHRWLGF